MRCLPGLFVAVALATIFALAGCAYEGAAPRERARRTILDLFTLASDRPELVSAYRRKLAAALY